MGGRVFVFKYADKTLPFTRLAAALIAAPLPMGLQLICLSIAGGEKRCAAASALETDTKNTTIIKKKSFFITLSLFSLVTAQYKLSLLNRN